MQSRTKKILVIGASGQIGMELTIALRVKFGNDCVVAADVMAEPSQLQGTGVWEELNVLSASGLQRMAIKHAVTEIYLLVEMLSVTAERDAQNAWQLNIQGLLNVLEVAREEQIKVFWPSSIAARAPASTVYGLSKYTGECWCHHYHEKYGVDVRSVRYPAFISPAAKPGGVGIDYVTGMFHAALDKKVYECFLQADTILPMIYMPDAVRAAVMLMEAPGENILRQTSYAIAALRFTPAELFQKIRACCPDFSITYQPDHRQKIADSWQESISEIENGQEAAGDWGWKAMYQLPWIVKEMLEKIKGQKLNTNIRKLETMGIL